MSEVLSGEVFCQVLSDLQVGVYITDRERRIVFWNAGAERITGYLRQEVLGRFCRENLLMHCDHQRRPVCGANCPLSEAMLDGKARESSLFLKHKLGHRVPVRVHSMPIRDERGTVIGAAECFQRQRDVPHPERRDPLHTCSYEVAGVPPYGFVLSELNMRLARAEETESGFGVVCVGVDRFEETRVTRGHEACETVLQVVANTLQNAMRPGDFLGSWTEGRLMLVLATATKEGVVRAAERLRALVACSTAVWWGDPLPLTIACGCTPATAGDHLENLTMRAERALGQALAEGGNRVVAGEGQG